jgi:hypothetical protein
VTPSGAGSVVSGRVLTLVGSFAIGEEEGWSAWSSGLRFGGLSARGRLDPGDQPADGFASQDDPQGVGGGGGMREAVGPRLDPFKDWIFERLAADPRIQSQRLREMAGELGYAGGKSIFDH